MATNQGNILGSKGAGLGCMTDLTPASQMTPAAAQIWSVPPVQPVSTFISGASRATQCVNVEPARGFVTTVPLSFFKPLSFPSDAVAPGVMSFDKVGDGASRGGGAGDGPGGIDGGNGDDDWPPTARIIRAARLDLRSKAVLDALRRAIQTAESAEKVREVLSMAEKRKIGQYDPISIFKDMKDWTSMPTGTYTPMPGDCVELRVELILRDFVINNKHGNVELVIARTLFNDALVRASKALEEASAESASWTLLRDEMSANLEVLQNYFERYESRIALPSPSSDDDEIVAAEQQVEPAMALRDLWPGPNAVEVIERFELDLHSDAILNEMLRQIENAASPYVIEHVLSLAQDEKVGSYDPNYHFRRLYYYMRTEESRVLIPGDDVDIPLDEAIATYLVSDHQANKNIIIAKRLFEAALARTEAVLGGTIDATQRAVIGTLDGKAKRRWKGLRLGLKSDIDVINGYFADYSGRINLPELNPR